MSRLFVVRHGQASFFASNYDQLSETGERQSQLLGQYWAEHRMGFDELIAGPRVRQQETARLVRAELAAAGLTAPEIETLAEMDEYQAEEIMKSALPALIESEPEIRRMQEAVDAAPDQAETLRRFQRMYEVVIRRWADGELVLEGIEPWAAFCDRVYRGFEAICAAGPASRRVALFTSGGPVGIAVERALGTGAGKALELAWMVRNGSVSEFLFTADRFTLSSFNTHPHLADPRLWTYR